MIATLRIAVVGLGYVGAPLAYSLAKHFRVTGFDVNAVRVDELRRGVDRTNEVPVEQLVDTVIWLSTDPTKLSDADLLIVTVPTPVGEGNVPDLASVQAASETVGRHMKRGATVVYESTVYPGVTEDIPILARASGFRHGLDFHVGYSPERINPGDRIHTLTSTTKVVAGDSPETLAFLGKVYGAITQTFLAPSIKVAEAAKVIENTQRDVNIALMNELSQVFNRLDIDTNDVIDAAMSKWNFLEFRPGLVGGHCISVDPYYLSHKAATEGFISDVILSAREINDSMASFITAELMKMLTRSHLLRKDTVVTVLGVTFKENVPDIRNSQVAEICRQLSQYGITAQVIDPLANAEEVLHEYGCTLTPGHAALRADAIVYAVAHDEFVREGWGLVERLSRPEQAIVLLDLKAVLDRSRKPALVHHWRP